ncbi:MAG TPA: glycosyltransferase, partial [Patescibacteria group bacterium]|nr:glycosyltransferase [Patescibacteria group bacterium]
MNILLVGGGSGGPVMPLLATAEAIKKTHPRARFLLVGTRSGPESNIAQKAGLDFAAISAGKLRRYLSWRNLLAPFQVGAGFWQARRILREFKPDCILAAGGFVQVPLVWAAYFMGIPVVLHQQDVLPSLANRLCQLAASKITVTFEGGQAAFASGLGLFYNRKRDKIIWTGNPFRQQLA